MRKKGKSNLKFFKDEKNIGHVFLGVGLLLFVLNITAYLNLFPKFLAYSTIATFDLSLFSSMIIIIAATYLITNEK